MLETIKAGFGSRWKEFLDINILDIGESFYQDRMVKMVADLADNDLLLEDESRKVMFIVYSWC